MKTDRLLAIIILLLNRGRVSATELAERFEVSIRTIYRDLEAINQAGVPIVAFPGSGGGYAIMDSFKMDRQMLSPQEIHTMIAALHGVNAAMDDRTIQNTIEKLKGIEIPQRVTAFAEPLYLDFSPWGLRKSEKTSLNLIRGAIATKQTIRFLYTNAGGEHQERIVEPHMVHFKDRAWYFLGFCRIREDFRIFKLSRMRQLSVEEELFTPRTLPEGFFEELSRMDPVKHLHIVLKFAPRVRVRVEDLFDADLIKYEEDGSLRVSVDYPEDDWVYGLILSYGESVEVLEPPHLREVIQEKALKIHHIYESTVEEISFEG